MKKLVCLIVLIPLAALAATGPQITIYNDDFATVKEDRTLTLQEGVSEIRVTDMSGRLEPDSVLLREFSKEPFGVKILEQSFINDQLTQGLLLYQLEGETVRFEEKREDGTIKETTGKVIRSGYVPGGGSEQPIIESEGAVRFSLPGQPVFEGLDSAAFLKPSLVWQIASKKAGECPIEVAYITAGMSWEATYSLIAPAEGSDEFDLSGWISLQNNTGKTFEDADIKLIAGDVAKVQPVLSRRKNARVAFAMDSDEFGGMPEERSFDEFHLYTLPRPVRLQNKELKQVEFIRAFGVKGSRIYTYSPLSSHRWGRGVNQDRNFMPDADKKVSVQIQISNSETNGLGMPLPKGRMRLYRTDSVDDRREFTGESEIDHLPKNELLKLDMGNAFDLVGERKRTDFTIDTTGKRMTESFEIKLRNRKEDPVEIRVVEPLYRGTNWKITTVNEAFKKTDSRTIEFNVPVPADGEAVVTYTVQYSW